MISINSVYHIRFADIFSFFFFNHLKKNCSVFVDRFCSTVSISFPELYIADSKKVVLAIGNWNWTLGI